LARNRRLINEKVNFSGTIIVHPSSNIPFVLVIQSTVFGTPLAALALNDVLHVPAAFLEMVQFIKNNGSLYQIFVFIFANWKSSVFLLLLII
jgi:hypothetical protein